MGLFLLTVELQIDLLRLVKFGRINRKECLALTNKFAFAVCIKPLNITRIFELQIEYAGFVGDQSGNGEQAAIDVARLDEAVALGAAERDALGAREIDQSELADDAALLRLLRGLDALARRRSARAR